MATDLTANFGDSEESKFIEIIDFTETTVELFVSILTFHEDQGDVLSVVNDWQTLLKLIEFCHFYQCAELYNKLLLLAKTHVNRTTIYEAISLVNRLHFDDWNDTIECLILRDVNIINTTQWNDLLIECPTSTAKFLCNILKNVIKADAPLQCDGALEQLSRPPDMEEGQLALSVLKFVMETISHHIDDDFDKVITQLCECLKLLSTRKETIEEIVKFLIQQGKTKGLRYIVVKICGKLYEGRSLESENGIGFRNEFMTRCQQEFEGVKNKLSKISEDINEWQDVENAVLFFGQLYCDMKIKDTINPVFRKTVFTFINTFLKSEKPEIISLLRKLLEIVKPTIAVEERVDTAEMLIEVNIFCLNKEKDNHLFNFAKDASSEVHKLETNYSYMEEGEKVFHVLRKTMVALLIDPEDTNEITTNMSEQLKQILTKEESMLGIVNFLIEKGKTEAYLRCIVAKVCHKLDEMRSPGQKNHIEFRKLFYTRCQQEFLAVKKKLNESQIESHEFQNIENVTLFFGQLYCSLKIKGKANPIFRSVVLEFVDFFQKSRKLELLFTLTKLYKASSYK